MADNTQNLVVVMTHVNPSEPLASLVSGTLWACTPCVKARGYGPEDLIDGVEITGASPKHELLTF